MKKKIVLMLLCLIMVLGTTGAIAESMYVVTTHPDESIYMRTKPDYDAGESIIPVPSGAEVTVRTVMADVPWVEASYGGYTGYIALESLSETRPDSGTPFISTGPVTRTMYVTSHNGKGVHLRTSPTYNDASNIIMTVPYGAQVGVITVMADVPWAMIEYDSQLGYMMMDYLSDNKPAPKTVSEDETNETTLEAMFDGFHKEGYEAIVVPAQGETYVNLRWAPSLSAPVRTTYGTEGMLWVSSDNGAWSEVYDESQDIHGYMESVFLQKQ